MKQGVKYYIREGGRDIEDRQKFTTRTDAPDPAEKHAGSEATAMLGK